MSRILPVILVALIAWLPGCETMANVGALDTILPSECREQEWVTADEPIDGLFERDFPPKLVRVTKVDGSVVQLKQPAIQGDNLIGHDANDYRDRRPYLFIPIEAITQVEELRWLPCEQ